MPSTGAQFGVGCFSLGVNVCSPSLLKVLVRVYSASVGVNVCSPHYRRCWLGCTVLVWVLMCAALTTEGAG